MVATSGHHPDKKSWERTHSSNGSRLVDLKKLEERTYATFLARARAAERLRFRGELWAIALALSSTATLTASLASLFSPDLFGGKIGLASALSSIMTLVLSLVVATFRFEARSRDMFHSYRMIQRTSVEAERLSSSNMDRADELHAIQQLQAEYQLGLDQSENHTSSDHVRAKRRAPAGKSGELQNCEILWARLDLILGHALPFTLILLSICVIVWLIISL